MKLQDLYYFRQLAETRSFTEAAEAFYISQPSISIALKRLEDEFNTRLISRDRSSKSVQLTETGELLYKRSQEIIDLIDKTKKDLHDMETREVHLGFLPTIGGHFLPSIMPHLSDYLPSLKLVEEESSDMMYDMVKTNQISSAIVGSDVPEFKEKWLTQIPIAVREMHIWVATHHPLAKYKRLNARMIKETSFVTLAKGYTHQRMFDKWAKANAVDQSRVHFTNEIQTANSMIASGMSAGLMIDLLVRDRADLVKLELTHAPKFYISLLVNTSSEVTSDQKAFNDKLIKVVQDLFSDETKQE